MHNRDARKRMNRGVPDEAPSKPLTAETVLTIWFGPFTLVFAVYWSYILVRVFEAARMQSSGMALSYSMMGMLMIVFFFGFSLYQRYLLEFGRAIHNWRRNLAICAIIGLLMSGFTLPTVWALIYIADPAGKFLPAFPTAVVLVLLLSIWMIFGLGAMVWEQVPAFRQLRWGGLDFRDE